MRSSCGTTGGYRPSNITNPLGLGAVSASHSPSTHPHPHPPVWTHDTLSRYPFRSLPRTTTTLKHQDLCRVGAGNGMALPGLGVTWPEASVARSGSGGLCRRHRGQALGHPSGCPVPGTPACSRCSGGRCPVATGAVVGSISVRERHIRKPICTACGGLCETKMLAHRPCKVSTIDGHFCLAQTTMGGAYCLNISGCGKLKAFCPRTMPNRVHTARHRVHRSLVAFGADKMLVLCHAPGHSIPAPRHIQFRRLLECPLILTDFIASGAGTGCAATVQQLVAHHARVHACAWHMHTGGFGTGEILKGEIWCAEKLAAILKYH